MKDRVKRFWAAFGTEGKLFCSSRSIALFAIAMLLLCTLVLWTGLGSANPEVGVAQTREEYLARLEEIDAALGDDTEGVMHDPVLEEGLLLEKQLILYYLETGTDGADYATVFKVPKYMSDYAQTGMGLLNGFLFWVIPCFAVFCLVRGLSCTAALSGKRVKLRLMCNCSRTQCLGAAFALDAIVLFSIAVAAFALRSIIAAFAYPQYFALRDGDLLVGFGSIHELFFSQFLAALALGAAAYFCGCLGSTLARSKRALWGTVFCIAVIGVVAATGAIISSQSDGERFFMLDYPLIGISFCQSGFREDTFFVQWAVCIGFAAVCAAATIFRYRRKVDIS